MNRHLLTRSGSGSLLLYSGITSWDWAGHSSHSWRWWGSWCWRGGKGK